MMYLAIDQGNSATKIAVGHAAGIVQRWTWEPGNSGMLTDAIHQYGIRKGIVSSVAREENRRWMMELEEQLPLVWLNAATPVPLKNDYHTPHTLGYDRMAGAVGAWKLFPGTASLVIDAGTCINYEFVSATGAYKGGAIAPGMRMRFRALHEFTGKLPLITEPFQAEDPGPWLGTDTVTSLLSGVMNGMLLEIDGVISQYREMHGDVKAIITGGDADYFGKYLKNQIFAQPDLVLLGLLEILRFIDERDA